MFTCQTFPYQQIINISTIMYGSVYYTHSYNNVIVAQFISEKKKNLVPYLCPVRCTPLSVVGSRLG